MVRNAVLIPTLVSLLAAFTGCVKSGDYDLEVSASGVLVMPRNDYDYDGGATRNADGSIHVWLDGENNKVRMEAEVDEAAATATLTWTSVQARQPFHDGGVALGLEMFGPEGPPDPRYPAAFAYAAAWGTVDRAVNGRSEHDPTTGDPGFRATLFIVRGQIREDQSGMVYNANRDAAYDPRIPDDAWVNPRGAQIILELRTATDYLWRHYAWSDAVIVAAGG